MTLKRGSRLEFLSRKSESGSASVEFVVLAIPLFLPILIFLTQFSEVSRVEIESRNLIREVVRAYVSSASTEEAERNSKFVLSVGSDKLRFTKSELASMELSFDCSGRPCLSPGERVRGELSLTLDITHRIVKVSATEYVSPWQ